MEAIDVMKQLYANHHRGPMGPEIEKQMIAEQQMAQAEVAGTQQEAEVGLDDGQGLRPKRYHIASRFIRIAELPARRQG